MVASNQLSLKKEILTLHTSITNRDLKTAASTARLDTDVETSAPLYLCQKNTMVTKHLEFFYL